MPSSKRIQDIKTNLLHPATTSHFEVQIPFPRDLPITDRYWKDNGVKINQDRLNLLCSEATLPGSNLATLELTNDHTGVTERHAYRRVYDDRIDLTFYVDAENYLPIRFFETWMKYIADESKSDKTKQGNILRGTNLNASNYFYRFKYRDQYAAQQGLNVTKFERSSKNYAYTDKYDFKTKADVMTYKFVSAYPISISSMPVSYDSSSLLKCMVSFTYIRYYVDGAVEASNNTSTPVQALTPEQTARINSIAFNPNTNLGLNYENLTTTGGFSIPAAQSSGNNLSVQDAYSGNFTLNR